MSESLEKYDLAASFIAVMLRLIYDGPKSRQGPLVLDEATTLQTVALAARFAEVTGGEPVTAETLRERLRGIAGGPSKVAEHGEARILESGDDSQGNEGGMWCVYMSWPGGGWWWCHRIYKLGDF
jgi:hypothetical protein